MGYDEWLSHNPADDGGEQDLELVFECDNEWPADENDPDLYDWIQCDFNDVVELPDTWVSYSGTASGQWTCPKCGKVTEFEVEVGSRYDDDY